MNCFTRLGAQNINAKGFFYWMAFHCFYLCTGRKRAQCVLVFFVCEGNCGFPTVFKSVWLRQTLTQCAWGLGWFRFSLMSESKYCWLRHSSSKRGVVEGVQGCWRPPTGLGQRPPLSHFMQCIEDLVLGLFHPCGPLDNLPLCLPPSLSQLPWVEELNSMCVWSAVVRAMTCLVGGIKQQWVFIKTCRPLLQSRVCVEGKAMVCCGCIVRELMQKINDGRNRMLFCFSMVTGPDGC